MRDDFGYGSSPNNMFKMDSIVRTAEIWIQLSSDAGHFLIDWIVVAPFTPNGPHTWSTTTTPAPSTSTTTTQTTVSFPRPSL